MKDIFHWLHILIWCNFVFALITIKLLLHYFSGNVWPVLYNPLNSYSLHFYMNPLAEFIHFNSRKDKINSIFYEISFLNFLIKDEQGLPCTLPALFVLLHSVISPLTNDPSFKILGPRLNNYVFLARRCSEDSESWSILCPGYIPPSNQVNKFCIIFSRSFWHNFIIM